MVATPEGRVNYNGSTFTNEYIISDQQGNARVSFNNAGTGGARLVTQENSYYGFGMVMPGSVVTGGDNKKLYNGQSEWQNDYTNMPDYYQTPGRNYDAEIGRFISADPTPESATDMSTYHYAGDNPIMMNDPGGNAAGTTGPLAKVYGDNPENNFWMEINNPEARLGETITARGRIMSQLQAEVDQQMGDLGNEVAAEQRAQAANAAFWGNAIANVNRLIGGLNDSNYTGVDFQNSAAFVAFGLTSLDANQSYNFDLDKEGALSMSLHNDARDNAKYYATTGGIGDFLGGNQGKAWERLVLPTSAWNTQLPDMTGCFRACEVMTGTQPPLNHALLIGDDSDWINAAFGTNAIMNMLVSGRPVIVGVDYKPGGPNPDGITDHFVVIAGYGVDDRGYSYFRFYDPGTSSFSNGTSPANRFYLDYDNPYLLGSTAYAPNRDYWVSQVRLP